MTNLMETTAPHLAPDDDAAQVAETASAPASNGRKAVRKGEDRTLYEWFDDKGNKVKERRDTHMIRITFAEAADTPVEIDWLRDPEHYNTLVAYAVEGLDLRVRNSYSTISSAKATKNLPATERVRLVQEVIEFTKANNGQWSKGTRAERFTQVDVWAECLLEAKGMEVTPERVAAMKARLQSKDQDGKTLLSHLKNRENTQFAKVQQLYDEKVAKEEETTTSDLDIDTLLSDIE